MSAERILVVEDEGIEALDLQHRLASLGYEVVGLAFSGEEAIELAEETQPDLVLMDIMLHGKMDGVTTAQQIRARWGTPVIYLTAYADKSTVQRARLTSPYGYLIKPFKERDLDITIDMALYKHRMEQQLRESREWFETTLRSIGDAVITTDNNGSITFMNAVAESLTGWRLREARGKRLTDVFRIIRRDTRLPSDNPAARVLREGRVVGLANHTLLVAKDGSEIPIDDSAAPIKNERDAITGVVLVFRDVTEREQAEAALHSAYDQLEKRVAGRTADLQAANELLKQEIEQRKLVEDSLQLKTIELEQANQAKDHFLAKMSHELRTPLNAIIGFTGVLQMKLAGPLTAEQEKQLSYVSISAKQLLLLINDLLDLAKIESGHTEIYPELVSCRSVLQEIATTLQPLASSKDLKLTVNLPEQDTQIKTDRRTLMQILLNLTHNAIKFTEEGEVRLDLGATAGATPKVILSVTDTGIGIKPEEQDRLFCAFTQVGAAGPYRSDGTGLGLYLSQKLAELLGGTLSFRSEYGKGSVFMLELPLSCQGGEK